MSLADKTCVPCKGGVPPLKGDALDKLKAEVLGWERISSFVTYSFVRGAHGERPGWPDTH